MVGIISLEITSSHSLLNIKFHRRPLIKVLMLTLIMLNVIVEKVKCNRNCGVTYIDFSNFASTQIAFKTKYCLLCLELKELQFQFTTCKSSNKNQLFSFSGGTYNNLYYINSVSNNSIFLNKNKYISAELLVINVNEDGGILISLTTEPLCLTFESNNNTQKELSTFFISCDYNEYQESQIFYLLHNGFELRKYYVKGYFTINNVPISSISSITSQITIFEKDDPSIKHIARFNNNYFEVHLEHSKAYKVSIIKPETCNSPTINEEHNEIIIQDICFEDPDDYNFKIPLIAPEFNLHITYTVSTLSCFNEIAFIKRIQIINVNSPSNNVWITVDSQSIIQIDPSFFIVGDQYKVVQPCYQGILLQFTFNCSFPINHYLNIYFGDLNPASNVESSSLYRNFSITQKVSNTVGFKAFFDFINFSEIICGNTEVLSDFVMIKKANAFLTWGPTFDIEYSCTQSSIVSDECLSLSFVDYTYTCPGTPIYYFGNNDIFYSCAPNCMNDLAVECPDNYLLRSMKFRLVPYDILCTLFCAYYIAVDFTCCKCSLSGYYQKKNIVNLKACVNNLEFVFTTLNNGEGINTLWFKTNNLDVDAPKVGLEYKVGILK